MKQLKLRGIDLSNFQPIAKENMKKIMGGTIENSFICSGPCVETSDCPPPCLCSAVTLRCINPD